MNELSLANLAYLAAAALFILALKGMAHPRTAVQGNLWSAAGMALAMGAALSAVPLALQSYAYIVAGIVAGGVIGAVLALRVQMTGMPQMVALLNGSGGLASVFVAGADLLQGYDRIGVRDPSISLDALAAVAATGIIGAVTFWGSLLAWAKLEELAIVKRPVAYPFQQAINAVLAAILLLLAAGMAWAGLNGNPAWAVALYVLVAVVASVLGVTLVNPIGGADMPVVIALLNSYSGLAAAATGFVIGNSVLIIAGSLVGASGIILCQLMCRAMNRSLVNVLFGAASSASAGPSADEVYAGVRSTTAEDVALLLDGARRVVIVPGYGLAVSQAQHAVRDLARALEARGCEVEFAIHPVAGRMPGHMNVLLAEADIAYDKLKEMDQINPTLETVDVALVLGANDVVNPVARTDPQSPLAGMPIIDVDKCRQVVVIKRSLSPGFANVPNPLFAAPNAQLLFADGKQAVLDIVQELAKA